jgi:hypothetical protein
MARQSSFRPPDVNLVDAILRAAEQTGEDGKGSGGLVGYFKSVARKHPRLFLSFLAKLPPDAALESEKALQTYTREEFIEQLRKRGLPVRQLVPGEDPPRPQARGPKTSSS